ncbi:MAG: hypothetical protein LBR44_03370, partial [Clostridiales Family XIII bacterium]|nr:hypothetical protein [Clostridiales Family XIII bacterium]
MGIPLSAAYAVDEGGSGGEAGGLTYASTDAGGLPSAPTDEGEADSAGDTSIVIAAPSQDGVTSEAPGSDPESISESEAASDSQPASESTGDAGGLPSAPTDTTGEAGGLPSAPTDDTGEAGGIHALAIEPLASTSWVAVDDDPVYGDAFVWSTTVNDWSGSNTSLKDALDAIVISSVNPYIIFISGDITMGDTYTLATGKVVLRKSTEPGGTTVTYSNFQDLCVPWDYTQPYTNTAAASPDLYDDVADWNLYSADGKRHFIINAGSATSLTTENITLNGGIPLDNPEAVGGGIAITGNSSVTLCANVVNCQSTARVGGAGVSLESKATVTVKGGVIAKNRQIASGDSFGAGGIGTMSTAQAGGVINLNGYTIIEDNKTGSYGGGVFFYSAGTCVFDGNVLIRRNEASNGGGIFVRHKINLTIQGNVTIAQNHAAATQASMNGVFYGGTGGGAFFAGYDTASVSIKGNATFDGNTADRGGGGIYLNGVDSATNRADYQAVTLTLTGGQFTGNQALGTARDIPAAAMPDTALAIGAGGAIFTYFPRTIKIPAYSTVSFTGNHGTFSAFLDNTDLQTLDSALHVQSFFSGDDYVSHIGKADVHTSIVNTPGPAGYNYYNLYNNYDIGVPNNLTLGMYTPITVSVLPAGGAGGQVVEDSNNVYIDPLGTGARQAALGSTLKYTPQAASGWYLKSF